MDTDTLQEHAQQVIEDYNRNATIRLPTPPVNRAQQQAFDTRSTDTVRDILGHERARSRRELLLTMLALPPAVILAPLLVKWLLEGSGAMSAGAVIVDVGTAAAVTAGLAVALTMLLPRVIALEKACALLARTDDAPADQA